MRSAFQKLFLLTLICLMAGFSQGVLAQSTIPGWEQPQNLSLSGAASQPRVVSGPDDRLQVFWWDLFDGLMTSISEENTSSLDSNFTWSQPQKTAIQSIGLVNMPTILADQSGWVHAFWLEENPLEKGTHFLMHSRMRFGTAEWSFPQSLAESALSFHISPSPSGGLSLAYVRKEHTLEFPAGLYVTRNAGGESEWRPPVLVYASIYFRLLSAEQVWMRVWDTGENKMYLAWDDPHLGLAYFSGSQDGGESWRSPEPLGQAEDRPIHPRVVGLPNGDILRIWQASINSQCTLLLQRSNALLAEPGETEEPEELKWSEPTRVLEGLTACPDADSFRFLDDQLLWLWGEGTGRLIVSAWEDSQLQWSLPHEVSFNFQDLQSDEQVILSDLHSTFFGERMMVLGADATESEVWMSSARADILELVYSPPSPWTETVPLSIPGEGVGLPAVAVDNDGQAHVVWSKAKEAESSSVNLMYAHWNGREVSPPVTILNLGSDSIARHPTLLADAQGRLHLTWIGDLDGKLYYSSVLSQDARSSSAWTSPRAISDLSLASSPQMGIDAAGRLYVLFVIPLNEDRGVYLAVSEDSGRNWLPQKNIFDAKSHNWQMVDHPTLVVEPDGVLHAAWVNASIPGTTSPLGIFYSRSADRGETWSDPLVLLGPGYDYPRLAIATQQVHLLFADAKMDLWHRWIPYGDLSTNGELWSAAARVPGWLGVDLPFAAAVDGLIPEGTLHLVGGKGSSEQKPLYAYWDGNRWSSLEWFSSVDRPAAIHGAAVATRYTGGTLAAAWLVPFDRDNPEIVLSFVARSIPELQLPVTGPPAVDIEINSQATETVTAATASPSPTPTPSPTPDLNRQPAPTSTGGLPPLALGGGLAALIVFGGLFTRQWRKH